MKLEDITCKYCYENVLRWMKNHPDQLEEEQKKLLEQEPEDGEE